ncbi:efflux RND transporter permease subunit [Oceaniserpentilla sp. 4NH20-0058]|uniref:efflux RND transporter permease subunit n=1 Tax=Oceaniserpentilla sp. 4NH20-0058 TaxID=3127660 RepID=UPI00310C3A97
MKLPEIAIDNHQITYLIISILVLLGVVSFLTMPRAEDPQLDFPAVSIVVVNPGTNPLDMESLVVDPIESAVNELEDIEKVKTNIEDGLARFEVDFIYGSDPDEKYDDVLTAVNNIRNQLPNGIVKLDIKKISPSEVGILQIALLTKQSNFVGLRPISEQLENRLKRVPGVKRVDVEAIPDLEVQVLLQPAKLHALNLSWQTVYQAVNSASLNIPGGHVHAGERRFSVLTSGDFKNLEEIENIVVASIDNQPIYLRNVAKIKLGEALPSYRGFYKGQPAIFLSIIQRHGSNIFNVSEKIKQELTDFELDMNEEFGIQIVNDQSISVKSRVDGFFNNLFQGLVLVALACLLVLGRGPSFVVVLAIPISIFIAIGWLDLSGFAIQQMSIVGLVIALGLLVDNAIVVIENVMRLQRTGLSPMQAAKKGSTQVAMAIVSGTLTTILSFVPMLLMQNGSGSFIRSMPVTVVLTLIASLFIALLLTPLLSTRLQYKKNTTTKTQTLLDKLSTGRYARTLKWSLLHRKSVIAMALVVFIFAIGLFPFIGVSLFPKAEKPMLLVNIELPEGGSFYQTQEHAIRIEEKLLGYSIVDDVVMNIGRGNPRIYYNVSPNRQTPNFSQLFVKLNKSELNIVEPFVERLRHELNQQAGVRVLIKEFHQGPPAEAPITVRVIGDEWESIRHIAKQVESIMVNHAGTVNVDNPTGKNKIDIKLNINRDKAAMLGLSVSTIDQTVRSALVGLPMGTYKDQLGDEFIITLKSSDSLEPQLRAFDTMQLQSPSGAMIPLNQVASLQMANSIPGIQHHNLKRMGRVTADVKSGFNIANVTSELSQELNLLSLPKGVSLNFGGEQESRQESFGGMAKALIIAMLGIFSVLVMQFKSFKQPLIIFSAIPFAATGAFFALFISGHTFSFTAFVGLTSLVGIVVNNAIIIVDYANQKIHEGIDIFDAILQSAQVRMTPILLTTVTTIGGLLPLTLSGSSMWSPMGWAIIGGLIVSTLLSLFVVPVLYVIFTTQADVVKNLKAA